MKSGDANLNLIEKNIFSFEYIENLIGMVVLEEIEQVRAKFRKYTREAFLKLPRLARAKDLEYWTSVVALVFLLWN